MHYLGTHMRFYRQSPYHIDLYVNLPLNEFHAAISFQSNTLMRLIIDISSSTFSCSGTRGLFNAMHQNTC